ncbi:Cytochrome P450 89A9 [Platanthera zijinensis]|uniref:Cytochrome P450 89A9 n=1 Tax=Platanthera zijinensis TaxID=2320716 RepID=A0AAP0G2R2_9ASPA
MEAFFKEAFYLLIIVIALLFSTKLSFFLLRPSKKSNLPPGPPSIPVIGNLLWLRHFPSISNIETLLGDLRRHLGPIITLQIGSRRSIYITDRSLAHKALIELGSVFSTRPPRPPSGRFLNSDVLNITFSPYGGKWRLLRRNLTAEILQPAKLHLFSHDRSWILGLLLRRLHAKSQESSQRVVVPVAIFQFAMFGLLARMCFGERLAEEAITEIEIATRELILYLNTSLRILAFVPKFLSTFLFRERWRTLLRLRQRQSELFLPLIRARRERRKNADEERLMLYSYVDSLLRIAIAEEGGRRLTDQELVSLCSEFLMAGAETTASALHWIMAEITARPAVQAKLAEEVETRSGEEIKDEDLPKMSYLKAVVMEGLRRHPPVHFLLPHSVTEDTVFEGYLIPKNVPVIFPVSELGWDERVWSEPMEFVPERFMAGGDGEGVDITGSREIKMMPFGAGRRMCPGFGLAMLHLEYFVANLVREFRWEAMDGEQIDFSVKFEFSTTMKKPFRARITPRRKVC